MFGNFIDNMNRKVPEIFTKLLQKAYGLISSFVYNGNVVNRKRNACKNLVKPYTGMA